MCQALLAILLVCSSGKGSSLAFHWPPSPRASPRLTRPRPVLDSACSPLDLLYHAAQKPTAQDVGPQNTLSKGNPEEDGWDYEWKRPSGMKHRSPSFTRPSRSRPSSGRNSPSKGVFHSDRRIYGDLDYDSLLGYSSEFLASILCPLQSQCHQKFEMVVDDLAFIGHPVSADSDGVWRFKQEKTTSRGRKPEKQSSAEVEAHDELPPSESSAAQPSLQTFHLVFVMDLPDPSSSVSGDVYQYFHVIYEQIVFVVTAVLYQEQVLHNFMDTECEGLNTLKEACMAKGDNFSDYLSEALKISSVAKSIQTLHDCIRDNQIATLSINSVAFELQLPPYLDALLHPEEDASDFVQHDESDSVSWGNDLSFGWRLPSLAPWKSLLLLHSDSERGDLFNNMRNPSLSPEDQELAKGLMLFLKSASVFTSLADMAHDLSWDLETQVYPTVRWLVAHRRAKIVDNVHDALRTLFVVAEKLDRSLSELALEFSADFQGEDVLPLPEILSLLSSPSPMEITRSDKDRLFFATVVGEKEKLPLYRRVVIWMLKKDVITALHLRVRIVVTAKVKARARQLSSKHLTSSRSESRGAGRELAERAKIRLNEKESHKSYKMFKKSRGRSFFRGSALQLDDSDSGSPAPVPAPTVAFANQENKQRSFSSNPASHNREEKQKSESELGLALAIRLGAAGWEGGDDDERKQFMEENSTKDSIIWNPARPTALEEKWLQVMSEGKDPDLVMRFEQIYQYFDGRKTADEIMYRVNIKGKELRRVLDHYREHLITFSHPA